jgi:hypothetical protein
VTIGMPLTVDATPPQSHHRVIGARPTGLHRNAHAEDSPPRTAVREDEDHV